MPPPGTYISPDETGMYYLQSRYYNPGWGRFINADNLIIEADTLGQNLFSYCNNNPVNYHDPHGHLLSEIGLVLATYSTEIIAAAVAVVIGGTIAFSQKAKEAIINAANAAWDSVVNAASTVHTLAKATIEVAKADAKVRATVQETSKNRYWSANINKYSIDIGRPLTYTQAVKEVAAGRNVFAVTEFEAKAVARAAGGSSGRNNTPLVPEIDKGMNGVPGYYYHYHTYNRSGGHVFYLFGE